MPNKFDEFLFDGGHFDGPIIVQTTADGFTSYLALNAIPRGSVTVEPIPRATVSLDSIPRGTVTV